MPQKPRPTLVASDNPKARTLRAGKGRSRGHLPELPASTAQSHLSLYHGCPTVKESQGGLCNLPAFQSLLNKL